MRETVPLSSVESVLEAAATLEAITSSSSVVSCGITLVRFTVRTKFNRNRPFIDDFNGHRCPEDSCGHPVVAKDLAQVIRIQIIQTFGKLRWRSMRETGPVSFPDVCIQRELRDDKSLAPCVEERSVHLIVIVREDTQVGGLLGKMPRVIPGITIAHTDKDREAGPDFAGLLSVHRDDSSAYALDKCLHLDFF